MGGGFFSGVGMRYNSSSQYVKGKVIAMGSSDDSSRMPRYELVRVSTGVEVPSFLAHELSVVGVPRRVIGHEYRALETAARVPALGSDDLLAFGENGLNGRICVRSTEGSVVSVELGRVPVIGYVNRDIESFRKCVAVVIERFPFYATDEDPNLYGEVAEDLRNSLSRIDDSIMVDDDFWTTFSDDVAIGDYSTEQILEINE